MHAGSAQDSETTTKPVIYVGCSKDKIAISSIISSTMGSFAKGPLTLRELDEDHWVIWSHADELNQELLNWVKTIGA